MKNNYYNTEKRLYNIYYGMVHRCTNCKVRSYERYGGRGISVCEEWMNDRDGFITWAKQNGYEDGLQIDRIDNDGNYEPGNCRWVTGKENARNTSRTVMVDHEGQVLPLIDICEELKLPVEKIRQRVRVANLRDAIRGHVYGTDNPQHFASIERHLAKKQKIKELAEIIDQHICFIHIIQPFN